MMSFFTRLESRIDAVESLLCVGLDPHPGDLPAWNSESVKTFCLRLIRETQEIAAAYKPNVAFFEALGPDGLAALSVVIETIPDEIPVILDAKRGDISSTARAYAQAIFQTLGADAVTINPYLGHDSLEPFLIDPDKGVFLLCKTSNPSASDLQDLRVFSSLLGCGGIPDKISRLPIPLYLQVAKLAQDWNTRDNLGLVVGATQPESLNRIRSVSPDSWILAPGIGAQGGNIGEALKAGLRSDGLGMLIPVSRGISRAENPAKAAYKIRDTINHERQAFSITFPMWRDGPEGPTPVRFDQELARIADGLLQAGCIKFGTYKLKSGIASPIYIDLRRLVGYPKLLLDVAQAYIHVLNKLQFDHLAPLPYAALPIGTAISLQSGWSMIYPRKEVKTYGTSSDIEGVFQSGEKAVVIDDLISTGGSKFEGIQKLESRGLKVEDVIVLIDRSHRGGKELSRSGYKLHSVLNLSQILDYYEHTGYVEKSKLSTTKNFIRQQGRE
jgi:uridine monophosphate synthetase